MGLDQGSARHIDRLLIHALSSAPTRTRQATCPGSALYTRAHHPMRLESLRTRAILLREHRPLYIRRRSAQRGDCRIISTGYAGWLYNILSQIGHPRP